MKSFSGSRAFTPKPSQLNQSEADEGQNHPQFQDNESLRAELLNKSSELTQLNSKLCKLQQKYADLLQSISSQPASPAAPQNYSNCDQNELELQQWAQMWLRIYSMLAPALNYSAPAPESDIQRREVLVEMISMLLSRLNAAPQDIETHKLQKKLEESKIRIQSLKSKYKDLSSELKRNRKLIESHLEGIKSDEKTALDEKLCEIEELLRHHLRLQSSICEFSDEDLAESPKHRSKKDYRQKAKVAKVLPVWKDTEEEEDEGKTEIREERSYRHATTYEEEIKPPESEKKRGKTLPALAKADILGGRAAEPAAETKHSKSKERRAPDDFPKKYSEHVNQLIEVTNQLQRDYSKLRPLIGDPSSLSLSTLSKIHDNLASTEQSEREE